MKNGEEISLSYFQGSFEEMLVSFNITASKLNGKRIDISTDCMRSFASAVKRDEATAGTQFQYGIIRINMQCFKEKKGILCRVVDLRVCLNDKVMEMKNVCCIILFFHMINLLIHHRKDVVYVLKMMVLNLFGGNLL